jgi:phosphoglycolate phosphatase
MHFDGLIFDLDGTLWDCSQASADAVNRAYQEFGITKRVTQQCIRIMSGKPASECFDILLQEVPSEVRRDLRCSLKELETSAIMTHAPMALYPEVEQGLHELRTLYKLYVVSNCDTPYLDVFHRHTSIGTIFADTECFGRTGKRKGENIRAVVERNQLLSPCYIGDTAGDEDASNEAGVPFFHVSYGFGTPGGSPVAFDSFTELTRFFIAAGRALR